MSSIEHSTSISWTLTSKASLLAVSIVDWDNWGKRHIVVQIIQCCWLIRISMSIRNSNSNKNLNKSTGHEWSQYYSIQQLNVTNDPNQSQRFEHKTTFR